MKIRHPLFVGLVAALTVSLAIASASAVAAQTPFKGTVEAVETGTTIFPIRTLDRVGSGNATYLGKYTEHITMQIYRSHPECNGGRHVHSSKRRHLDRHDRRTGNPDGPHHALDCRGLHRHRRNGTLRRRNRQLHAEQHIGSDDGREFRHAQRSNRPVSAVRHAFRLQARHRSEARGGGLCRAALSQVGLTQSRPVRPRRPAPTVYMRARCRSTSRHQGGTLAGRYLAAYPCRRRGLRRACDRCARDSCPSARVLSRSVSASGAPRPFDAGARVAQCEGL